MQRYRILFLRHVLAHNPHRGHVRILLENISIVRAPCAGTYERGSKRQSQRNGFQLEAARKAALGVEDSLILNDACHDGPAIEMHRLLENAEHRSGRMAHVVLADLT